MRLLHLVVGPNGAGKTTFVAEYLAPTAPGLPLVNADEIARRRWPDAQAEHAYEAARIAEETRSALIADGRSFIAETVFSHPSKLQLLEEAGQAGYVVWLHVLMVPDELSVLRVRYRVAAGGHDVPEVKIRDRYRRLWPLVADAVRRADQGTVYDHSAISGPKIVATFHLGMPGLTAWPEWTPAELRALS